MKFGLIWTKEIKTALFPFAQKTIFRSSLILFLKIYPDLTILNPNKMAKGMNSQKAAKKEPAKTPKEKKEEKREKKKAGYQ
jgi:hypothetical protein